MLFPTDPNKRPELWIKLAEKAAAGAVSFIVHDGQVLSDEAQQIPLDEEVDQIVSSFRSCDVVRFGSSRGQAIGPFFAFNVSEGIARLVEYAIDPNIQAASSEAMQEALQSVAIDLFFERKEITEISLPILLARWEINEWRATVTEVDKTSLKRVAAT